MAATTIKDTWTKPSRRVEARERGGFGWGGGEWWGETADNCNNNNKVIFLKIVMADSYRTKQNTMLLL